jgi:two-component system, OmpR family, catabolic regulation response regulator CreB
MVQGKRILVVEDERAIAETILFALKTEGFLPTWAANAGQAKDLLDGNVFDLLILDIGLPDISGFDLCREVRNGSQIPIFFLTARSEEIDRVLGLELGADDYIAKPFSPRELTARVKSLFRRIEAPRASIPKNPLGKFQLNEDRASISFKGALLELTRTEYRLLSLLVRRPGRVFSRQEILDRISDNPEMSLDRTIDSHVKSLRAKLRELDSSCDWIVTHRGFGYSLADGAS